MTRPRDLCVEKAMRRWNRSTRLMEDTAAATSHEFTWLDSWGMYTYDCAKARETTPMIRIEFTKASTKNIANAGPDENGVRTDYSILRRAYAVRIHQDKGFVRLGYEMNGH